MAASVLSLLTPVKLLIDKSYLNKVARMQIVGGELLLPDATRRLSSLASSSDEIVVTDVIDDIDSTGEAIFYHPIFGPILAHDYGYKSLFSTQRFVRQLREADQNPNVIAHFLHICSGGGEAWFLDKGAEAVRSCRKPVYAFVEMHCCSAAYYLAANASVIKAYTQNDTIGSIGVMVSFWDEESFYKKMGFRKVEEYAHGSTKKNKKFNDLVNGDPEQYIREELDPLRNQFIAEIRGARPQLDKLPDDDPVMQGETFSATVAQEKGLIDGIVDIEDAIIEAYQLGITTQKNNNYLNNL